MKRELAFVALLAACRAEAEPVHILVAASIEEPILELAGPEARVAAASSSVLARQIASGAPGDLFVSADREWADWVSSRAAVLEKAVVASNRLVLIADANDSRSTDELLSSRLAIADPTHVPAGRYARAALEKMGRYHDSIAAAGDVRAALALVERGEADAAIVYATDAWLSRRVRVALEIESPLPIDCVAVLLGERARPLFQRLTSEEGRRVLERHGFLPP